MVRQPTKTGADGQVEQEKPENQEKEQVAQPDQDFAPTTKKSKSSKGGRHLSNSAAAVKNRNRRHGLTAERLALDNARIAKNGRRRYYMKARKQEPMYAAGNEDMRRALEAVWRKQFDAMEMVKEAQEKISEVQKE